MPNTTIPFSDPGRDLIAAASERPASILAALLTTAIIYLWINNCNDRRRSGIVLLMYVLSAAAFWLNSLWTGECGARQARLFRVVGNSLLLTVGALMVLPSALTNLGLLEEPAYCSIPSGPDVFDSELVASSPATVLDSQSTARIALAYDIVEAVRAMEVDSDLNFDYLTSEVLFSIRGP